MTPSPTHKARQADRARARPQATTLGAALALVAVVLLSGCISMATEAPAIGADAVDSSGQWQDGVLVLHPNQSAFWDGPHIAEAEVGMAILTDNGVAYDRCAAVEPDPCSYFPIEVNGHASRLRVGLDTPDAYDEFDLLLIDPDGVEVDMMWGKWSQEVFAEDPVAGTWTAKVIPTEVDDAVFQMRAKLEGPRPAMPELPRRDILPDLRAEPGFDFTFARPIPLGYASAPWPLSDNCLIDEVIEDGAVRCLRFSFGYQNAGEGPYDVRFSPLSLDEDRGEVHQHILRSDGTYRTSEGGTYTYHATHAHYHYEGIFAADLFRVVDPGSGRIEGSGISAKYGACAHDWKIAAWERFDQARRDSQDSGTDCEAGPGRSPVKGMRIALSPGWTDIYPWNIPDNYVEFDGQPDGEYLLRTQVDVGDHLEESDETNNWGYSHILIEGDTVTLLERGFGTDPWDPKKTILTR